MRLAQVFSVSWYGLMLPLFVQAASQASNPPTADHADRPNIVLILADDLGWTDLSCMGSRYYETPNIDLLANAGMRFTDFHVSQNCAPTRAALMSGQYAPRTGVYTVDKLDRGRAEFRKMDTPQNKTDLPLDCMTVADTLRSAGYKTAMFGKWHLGQGDRFHPSKRGFDHAIVTGGGHFGFNTNPETDVPKETYLADFLTDKAVQFIEEHKDRPFFLYLPHFAVHTPLQAKKELIEKFREKPPAGGHHHATYAAMIASLDASVGRVLAKLDELQLSERTVVIFTSDNGGVGGYKSAGVIAEEITDNHPLRSGKGSLYEGGIRVPFFVKYPKMIKPGTSCDAPTVHVDMFPTFLELAGVTKPSQPLDGVSLVPLWRNPMTELPRPAIFWHFPGYLQGSPGSWRTTPVSVIRAGNYKLMEFLEDNRLELYNLKDDLSEKHNLADTMPGKTRDLAKQLHAWREAIHADMPTLKKPQS